MTSLLPVPAAMPAAEATPAARAATETTAAEAGASARRKAPFLSAMAEAAKGARADAALASGFGVSPGRSRVSVEGPGRRARTVEILAARPWEKHPATV